jgi:hypothetical protein
MIKADKARGKKLFNAGKTIETGVTLNNAFSIDDIQ